MPPLTKRLGKKPDRLDRRTLRFSRYVVPDKLPPLPAAVDHGTRVSAWPMDGNDEKGDCVLAANEHAIRGWTTYADGTPKAVSEQQVVALYDQLSPNDDGLEMLSTLNLWRQDGLWGDTIDAYASLDKDSLLQAEYAIWLFGSVNIGMSLPDRNTFGPWLDPAASGRPNPSNGHAIILVGFDSTRRMFQAVTWGELVEMSYDWYLAYVDEAYAVLSSVDWLDDSGRDPEGFDLAVLQQDLADIVDAPQPPSPEPPPPPDPPGPQPGPGCLSLIILPFVIVTLTKVLGLW